MTKNYDVLLYDFPCFLYKMKNHAFFLWIVLSFHLFVLSSHHESKRSE